MYQQLLREVINTLSTRALHLLGFLGIFVHTLSLTRPVINNYYTIGHLTAEWKQRARNTAIAQPFTQTRNEIVLPFEPVGDDASRRDGWVAVVSCEPSSNALFF